MCIYVSVETNLSIFGLLKLEIIDFLYHFKHIMRSGQKDGYVKFLFKTIDSQAFQLTPSACLWDIGASEGIVGVDETFSVSRSKHTKLTVLL
jgi:hypothetical protein